MATTDMSAGVITKSTVDGMGFDRVNQDVTDTEIISGTMVYAGSRVTSPIISGTYVCASETVYTEDVDASRDITNAEGELQSVVIGSTTTQVYGGIINVGSGTLGAGSNLAVKFGVTYTSPPHVFVSYLNEPPSIGAITGSDVKTTGFEALGDTASKKFNWMAAGV